MADAHQTQTNIHDLFTSWEAVKRKGGREGKRDELINSRRNHSEGWNEYKKYEKNANFIDPDVRVEKVRRDRSKLMKFKKWRNQPKRENERGKPTKTNPRKGEGERRHSRKFLNPDSTDSFLAEDRITSFYYIRVVLWRWVVLWWSLGVVLSCLLAFGTPLAHADANEAWLTGKWG